MTAVELYPTQREALEELSNGRILYGGVGSGKSITAAAYYMKKEQPKDVYVITTAKKRDSLDWDREFVRFGVGRKRDATVAGVLTVDSWNNIENYKGVVGAFFIFDEQRLVGNGSWVKCFLEISKRNTWIVLSATPGDTWMDYAPIFIANGFYRNRTEFLREHVVYKPFPKNIPIVDHYVNVGRLARLRNELLVEMPYFHHNTRHSKDVIVSYDKAKFMRVLKDRWNVYEDRPIKDVAELFRIMRRVVNSDPSRVEEVKELLKKHPKMIVFYNFNYELEALRTLKDFVPENEKKEKEQWNSGTINPQSEVDKIGESSGPITATAEEHGFTSTNQPTRESFVVAEWNGHKHEDVPTTDSWLYLVQYVAGAEAWECTSTDTMVFYSQTYSYKNWRQAHGRIDRPTTSFKDLYYYNLKSDSIIDLGIARALSEKKNFNESRFVKTL